MGRLFRWIPKKGWKRYIVLTFLGVVSFVVVLVIAGVLLVMNPSVQIWMFSKWVTHQLQQEIRIPPKPSSSARDLEKLSTEASKATSAAMLFNTTNVWSVHMEFTSEQWSGLGPKMVPPISVFDFFHPDGTPVLRNPAASRSGVAGVFGIDMVWSTATVTFGDLLFTNVGARFKGNGTFLNSIIAFGGYKRPFKVDLNDFEKSNQIGGAKHAELRQPGGRRFLPERYAGL